MLINCQSFAILIQLGNAIFVLDRLQLVKNKYSVNTANMSITLLLPLLILHNVE